MGILWLFSLFQVLQTKQEKLDLDFLFCLVSSRSQYSVTAY